MDESETTTGESGLAQAARAHGRASDTGRMVSVVVPVYYNTDSLPKLFDALAGVETQLQSRGLGLELVFVDDGSGDDSLLRLLELKATRPSTKVVKLTRNFGAVAASKMGFHFVTGDAFLILAADLQDPPELILELVDRWLAGAKYVVATREKRDDPPVSRLFARIYYYLIRAIAVRDYPEGGYDLSLMSREFLPLLRHSAKNINTPLYAYWLGFKPTFVSYIRRRREHGRSRWTFWKKVKFFLDSMLGFSIVPIRFISACGLIVAVASCAHGAMLALNTIRHGTDVPGFATIVTLVTFLLGLVIVMLGVIGEYLWRIFDEVTRKPEAVIDQIY
jgi:dolichol-phosphate mannosyltransferase